MTAPFDRSKADQMVRDLRSVYGEKLTRTQLIEFLASKGLGSSPGSVKNYLDVLKSLGYIALDPYGCGLITLIKEIPAQPRDRDLTSFM